MPRRGQCTFAEFPSPTMPKISVFVLLLLLLPAAAARAAGWLIATPAELVRGGEMLVLEAVRPDAATPWPDALRLRLRDDQGQVVHVELRAADDGAADAARRAYAARLPALAEGVLRADLADRPSNRLALIVRAGQPGDPLERMAAPAGDTAATAALRLDPLPEGEPALSANEPMYFVVGTRGGLNARFQLSFKYRLFDEKSMPAHLIPALGRMHIGYTQTSLWDLDGHSRPFRDTSYRPSLFWQGKLDEGRGGAWRPSYLRGGYEHESNGRDGARSRSIDTLFLQPAWRTDFADGRTLFFAPKFYAYLDRDDNRDIARYRGHADWVLRYGDERSWVVSARLRRGTAGHGSGQVDLSLPLRDPLFARVGGFLHVQLLSGHGETLLDYDVKRPPQLRIGFSIVR